MTHTGHRLATAALMIATTALLAGCLGRPGAPGLARAQSPASGTAAPRDVAVARGKVEVQGGLLEVQSAADGVVQAVTVQEGDAVRQGQVLVRLAPEGAAADVALARAELQLAEARHKAASARLPSARRLAKRLAEAAEAGATDQQRADEAHQAKRDATTAASVAAAEVAVARQKLKQVQLVAARQTLTAASDGTVVRLSVQPGARVVAQGGKPLLVLMPNRPLVVRAELNERFVAAVKPGMRATVTLDSDGASAALPAARVMRISPVFGASRLDDETALRSNVRVVDCYLEFDEPPALRVGQDVRVNIHE